LAAPFAESEESFIAGLLRIRTQHRTITRASRGLRAMKLRAEIVIEIDAADYIAAADHQRSVQAIFNEVRTRYGGASLAFRQLRERRGAAHPSSPVRHPRPTGAVAIYQDD
jgi:hypothetical protein